MDECSKEQRLLCGMLGFKCFECLVGEERRRWVIQYTRKRAKEQMEAMDDVIKGWTPDDLFI